MRARDAVGVSAAETLFYVQSELDKVLVLALGGEALAGLYAIIMRMVDLTAIAPSGAEHDADPMGSCGARQSRQSAQTGLKLDLAIGASSVVALAVLAFILSLMPNLLGKNISLGASYLWAGAAGSGVSQCDRTTHRPAVRASVHGDPGSAAWLSCDVEGQPVGPAAGFGIQRVRSCAVAERGLRGALCGVSAGDIRPSVSNQAVEDPVCTTRR